jgi:hypothetical protein
MVTAEVTDRQAHRQRDKAPQLGRELDERLDGKPAMALVGRLLEAKRNPSPNAPGRVKITPKQNGHGEPPSFAMLNQSCDVLGIPARVMLSEF